MPPAGAEPAVQAQAAAVASALDHVNALAHATIQLKHELRLMDHPDVIGRDAQLLRGYLDEVHLVELGIAHSLKLEDVQQPPDTS